MEPLEEGYECFGRPMRKTLKTAYCIQGPRWCAPGSRKRWAARAFALHHIVRVPNSRFVARCRINQEKARNRGKNGDKLARGVSLTPPRGSRSVGHSHRSCVRQPNGREELFHGRHAAIENNTQTAR